MADATRTLFLGLDACDHRVIEHLVAHGRCPNIGRLLTDAAVVPTLAPYGSFVGSTWMTFSTATAVGTHRYYNWVEYDRADYHNRVTSPTEARRPPFWLQLSAHGQRSGLFDIPHAQLPPDSFDGVLIKEWGAHDRHHGPASYPASWLEDHGDHPFGTQTSPLDSDQFAPCDYTLRDGRYRTVDEERRIYDLIVGGLLAKGKASTSLLAEGGWDLFASVIGETHCIGHQLWHVHDTTHPRHDPSTRMILGDPVEDVYERADQVVGQHLALVGDDAAVFLHLSHGMQAHHDGDHLLDVVLDRLDQPRAVGVRTRAARSVLERVPASISERLSSPAAAALRRRIADKPPAPPDPVRWRAQRRFFQIPNNTVVGGIRFNLVGREVEGLVRPDEVAALTAELTTALQRVINVDTGRSAVRAVVAAEQVLERSSDDAFPDLFVEWDRTRPVERVWSPDIGTVEIPYTHWRTGDHTDRGLLLVRAPGVEPGRRSDPMRLEDIAATLVGSLGIVLTDVDGVVRPDLVGERGVARVITPAPLGMRPDRAVATERDDGDDVVRLAEGAVGVAAAAAHRSDVALHAATVLDERLDAVDGALHALADSQASLAHAEQVISTMRWLEHTAVPEDDLVSVIIPTHHRPDGLRRALESVVAQRYSRWEAVVVDDGSDSAKAVIADLGDDRIVLVDVDHGGAAAARNHGLDVARGSLITYLDDDNSLDPGWLAAVVWAFAAHGDHDVLYGARVIDDDVRVYGHDGRGWPWLQLNPFDRDRLLEGNLADMGVLAHRRGLPEARFDDGLHEYADWDFFLALTEHRTPLLLPAIALYYATDGDDRLTGTGAADFERIRQKWSDR